MANDASHGLPALTVTVSDSYVVDPMPTDVPLNPTEGYVLTSPTGTPADQAWRPIVTTDGDILEIRGEGPPSLSLGSVGDYYKDTLNSQEYGPKTDDGWGSPRSLVGPGIPADGQDGQFLQKDGNDAPFSTRWATGFLLPDGGTAGQFIRKQSGTDGDTAFAAPAIGEVTGLQSALDSKQDASSAFDGDYGSLANVPSTFTPAAHTQAISTVTGLQDALDDKAATSHTQAISTVTGLQDALDDKASLAQGTPSGGTTGQILAKASGTDHDDEWIDPPGSGLVFNVLDYGAVGNGTTDDAAAIQSAIDAAETAGPGSIVLIPPRIYRIESTLRLKIGIQLQGVFGDDSSGTTQPPGDGKAMIRWHGATGGTMLLCRANDPGDQFPAGRIDQILFEARAVADICIHLSSPQSTWLGQVMTRAARLFGTWIVNDNGPSGGTVGTLFNQVHIADLQDMLGPSSDAWGSAWTPTENQTAGDFSTYNRTGLFIDGDSGGDGSIDNTAGTTVYVDCYQGEYVNGSALTITGVDTCRFNRVKAIERTGQTINGYGVHIKRFLVGDFLTSKNVIAHLGRGTVFVDDDTRGNRINASNSEGGSVYWETNTLLGETPNGTAAGTLYYEMMGRIKGESFSQPQLTLWDRLRVPIGSHFVASGSVAINGTSGVGGAGLVFPNAGGRATWCVEPPHTWTDGRVLGIRFLLHPRATSTGVVEFDVEMSSKAVGEDPGSNQIGATTVTATGPGTNFVLFEAQADFATALNYTRGDILHLSIARDAIDGFAGDVQIASIELVYLSDGPAPGGGDTQNYDVGPLLYNP